MLTLEDFIVDVLLVISALVTIFFLKKLITILKCLWEECKKESE